MLPPFAASLRRSIFSYIPRGATAHQSNMGAPPIAYLSLEETAKLVRAQPKREDFLISQSFRGLGGEVEGSSSSY